MAAYASITNPISKFALTSLLVMAAVNGVQAKDWFSSKSDPRTGSETTHSIPLSDLPTHGQRVYGAILRGGPFSYEKDGSVFGNREQLLPKARRGFYREYTVETPGSRDRGARRIVCGGEKPAPEACWYTADHYSSFKRILP